MATGIASNNDRQQEVEVLDISDDSSHCNNLPEFPSKVQFATGGRLNGHPLICGGQSTINSTDITNECYIYNEEWTLLTNMIHKRFGAGGTAIDENTFWIIGGSGQTQSSEYVFSNGSVIEGPDFDVGFEWHCMVRLDNGRIMIINHSKGTYACVNILLLQSDLTIYISIKHALKFIYI